MLTLVGAIRRKFSVRRLFDGNSAEAHFEEAAPTNQSSAWVIAHLVCLGLVISFGNTRPTRVHNPGSPRGSSSGVPALQGRGVAAKLLTIMGLGVGGNPGVAWFGVP